MVNWVYWPTHQYFFRILYISSLSNTNHYSNAFCISLNLWPTSQPFGHRGPGLTCVEQPFIFCFWIWSCSQNGILLSVHLYSQASLQLNQNVTSLFSTTSSGASNHLMTDFLMDIFALNGVLVQFRSFYLDLQIIKGT